MPTGEPYAWLTSISSNHIVYIYPLAREEVVIGRSPACHFSIPEFSGDFKYVSRKHARITHRLGDKSIFIEDLGSSHGTYVNGDEKNPLKGQRRLNWDDQITLGGATESPGVCMIKLTKEMPDVAVTAYKST